ncbi:MAG: TAT-variant-translocated molybdopterin oxidoreductase [Flavobacteriales bacterium]|nr:TAT-variant-translocated molybdopterin oxidoreductase [Flavobacteriales bacterium]
MSTTKTYWKGIEELDKDEQFVAASQKEFAQEIPVDEFLNDSKLSEEGTTRRDFLKFLGFSVTAASLAACETPVTKTIPYLVKPEEITPGIANYYASTFSDGNDYCSILVKTREGRPIHITGNKLSGVTKGGVSARVNSSVLSLYDSERLQGPLSSGAESSWDSVDGDILKKLAAIAAKGGSIRILSNSITSPSTKKVIAGFIEKYSEENEEGVAGDVQHITYDDISASGIINANVESFGVAGIPDYKFDKATAIVTIGADFMSNWLSSIQYNVDYASTRNPESGSMSSLIAFETTLSLTGSSADTRVAIKESEHGSVIVSLYNAVAKKIGGSTIAGGTDQYAESIELAAGRLVASKGTSLVIAGSNSKSVQVVVNGINELLGNYGTTLDIDANVTIKQGDDTKVEALLKEMASGKVNALITYGVNPVYTLPGASDAIAKVGLKISLADRNDETASICDYVCPDNHYLESWNDASPKKGEYSLCQPTISPLFKTRQAQDSLLAWSGNSSTYESFLMDNWKDSVLGTDASMDVWNDCLRDGVYSTTSGDIVDEDVEMQEGKTDGFSGDLSVAAAKIKASSTGGAVELVMYQKVGIGNGNQANNPWLQELPDPISKIVWDNYITMAPSDMTANGYEQKIGEATPADLVKLTVGGKSVELPVIVQPGQKAGTVGLALGYGRTNAGKAGNGVGANAFDFTSFIDGNITYSNLDVTVTGTGNKYEIASTQTHHTLMGRDMIKEASLEDFIKDNKAGNPDIMVTDYDGVKKNPYKINLWNDHDIEKGHRWGLSIDLSTCNGCSACVTSCHSENNVPVVGKDEVRRSRDMSWLRIDRYYSSDTKKDDFEIGFMDRAGLMEIPSENPQVAFQPLMCQHCNHAPCETVCPVAATTHSNEGLNQMAYNRCVGTRYCANNCPYKVRRFNWFNYNGNSDFATNPAQDSLARMVLNPDVVVRSRGVMEKCSLCVQRIQGGKLVAKKAGRPVEDGDMTTACAEACPTNAIQFGDLNNNATAVAKDASSDRGYVLIEELGVQPNIYYKTKVRNNA